MDEPLLACLMPGHCRRRFQTQTSAARDGQIDVRTSCADCGAVAHETVDYRELEEPTDADNRPRE